jgi:hypothetical protein
VSTYTRRPEAPAASFNERLPSSRILVGVLIPVLLISAVVVARGNASRIANQVRAVTGAVTSMTPAELAATAADALEQAVGAGGSGITFEIIQHSTMVASDGGEKLEVPDPTDPRKTIEVDSVPMATYVERGVWTSVGFHADIRRGPDDTSIQIDWDGTPLELGALVLDAVTYRNDGEGWYETDRPPGIGVDPATAALLPTMLRGLDGLADKADPQPDPSAAPSSSPEPGRAVPDPFADLAPARRLVGDSAVADMPGIVAVDLADATELREPAELAFDDRGRLIGLRVLARNTHVDRYDLLVETVITFGYPESAPALPKPEPRWVEPTQAPEAGS